MKFFVILITLVLIGTALAGAESFKVVSIENGAAEIRRGNNSRTITARAGDFLDDDWMVVKVNDDAVIIEKWVNDEERLRGILPAGLPEFKRMQ